MNNQSKIDAAAHKLATLHTELMAELDSATKHKFELYVKSYLESADSEHLGKLCAYDQETAMSLNRLVEAQFGKYVAFLFCPIIHERARDYVDSEKRDLADRMMRIAEGRG